MFHDWEENKRGYWEEYEQVSFSFEWYVLMKPLVYD